MPLTDGEVATYNAYLTEAEKAFHQLHVGGSVRVFVDQNQERVEYSALNKWALLAYINELRRVLGKDPFPFLGPSCPAGVIL